MSSLFFSSSSVPVHLSECISKARRTFPLYYISLTGHVAVVRQVGKRSPGGRAVSKQPCWGVRTSIGSAAVCFSVEGGPLLREWCKNWDLHQPSSKAGRGFLLCKDAATPHSLASRAGSPSLFNSCARTRFKYCRDVTTPITASGSFQEPPSGPGSQLLCRGHGLSP